MLYEQSCGLKKESWLQRVSECFQKHISFNGSYYFPMQKNTGLEMGLRSHNFFHVKVTVKHLIWTGSLIFFCSQKRDDQFNAHLLEVYFRVEWLTDWRCLATSSLDFIPNIQIGQSCTRQISLHGIKNVLIARLELWGNQLFFLLLLYYWFCSRLLAKIWLYAHVILQERRHSWGLQNYSLYRSYHCHCRSGIQHRGFHFSSILKKVA